jgi:hypothetical protein
VDASGRLIVIDHGNHRAQIFDADGGFLGAFGARQFTAAARGEARAAPRGKSAPEERADAARARPAEEPTSRPLAPPLAPVRWAHELRSNNETYVVRFTPDPEPIPLNALFTLRVAVSRADGSGAARLDLSVDAAMPEHRHGMSTQPVVERLADGTFQVRGMLLHMPGRWELYFDVRDERGVERAQRSLELE